MNIIEKIEKADELCSEIIKMTRNAILLNMRFLDAAVFRLVPRADLLTPTISSDARFFFYNPMFILKIYKQEQKSVNHAYLHVVLHCILRHSFVGDINREVWDLACDIAVESVIAEINCDSFEIQGMHNHSGILNDLSKKVKSLNAERLYRYFMNKKISSRQIAEMRSKFLVDDHARWYEYSQEPVVSDGGKSNKKKSGSRGDSQNSSEQGESGSQEDSQQQSTGSQAKNGNNTIENEIESMTREELEQQWKDISERVSMDMEAFSKSKGDLAGNMVQQLTEINRERYDYTAFLKKFAVMGEAMKINDDEFDYIYYTYGMKLYGKMPLIEPLEYKEVKRIKEFVIAIDTSGSVEGKLVQKFIQKTYNILKSTESFFNKINLHIIQCDAEIHEDAKITTQEEFDEYIKNMKLKGFGGTDFRPVFSHVEQLVKNGEFTHLKGLIYFTDGYGDFPECKPGFESAFVFLRSEYDNPEVPPWAIKLVLEDEDIK